MSTFICEKCGCIDNTSLGGTYNNVLGQLGLYLDPYANKTILCIECTPKFYYDGSINHDSGKWHNRFEKMHWSLYGRDVLMELYHRKHGDMVNALDFFSKYDKQV